MDEVKVLKAGGKQLSRKLWERVFTEDSEKFLDYYYTCKCAENTIYAIEREEQIVSMLHCNQYLLSAFDSVIETDYIVGVATDERFRHQGFMSALIRQALSDMYNKGRAFTFLMPAAESIYTPFGFRFIYKQPVINQKVSALHLLKAAETDISIQQLKTEVFPLNKTDFQYAANVINRSLNDNCDIFTLKTEKYFEDLKQQYVNDGGDICCIYYDGKPAAYFAYWLMEDKAEIPEFICILSEKDWLAGLAAGYLCNKYSINRVKIRGEKLAGCHYEKRIMARITNVISMLKLMRSDKDITIKLNIKDKLIAENNGEFLWRVGSEKSEVSHVLKDNDEETDCKLELTVEELTQWLFNGCCPIEKLKSIKTFNGVFINEIV